MKRIAFLLLFSTLLSSCIVPSPVGPSSEPSEIPGPSEYIPPSDPYVDIDTLEEKIEFYNATTYVRATSYEDAQYRTLHGLLSGNAEDQTYLLPSNINLPKKNGLFYRATDALYTYRPDGSFESYRLYNLNGSYKKIYYGGAYQEINEVAAYLLAFAEVPPNSNYDKNSGKQTSIDTWWKFGRVNVGYYSGPGTSRYQYEPAFYRQNESGYRYTETDFGPTIYNPAELGGGGYSRGPYNDGSAIIRGTSRLCFLAKDENGDNLPDLDGRYVYYTDNHYNDFQEYLNYENGWGEIFGNMTVGNEYNTYNSSNPPSSFKPTEHALLNTFKNL